MRSACSDFKTRAQELLRMLTTSTCSKRYSNDALRIWLIALYLLRMSSTFLQCARIWNCACALVVLNLKHTQTMVCAYFSPRLKYCACKNRNFDTKTCAHQLLRILSRMYVVENKSEQVFAHMPDQFITTAHEYDDYKMCPNMKLMRISCCYPRTCLNILLCAYFCARLIYCACENRFFNDKTCAHELLRMVRICPRLKRYSNDTLRICLISF